MQDYLPNTNAAPWWSYSDRYTRITIGEGITHIGKYSFYQTQATQVTVPSSLQSIGASAFYQAYSLNTCSRQGANVLPEGLKSIGSGAFMYCSSLKTIVLPEGLETLGNSCFQISGLTGITIPGSVGALDNAMFQSCISLESVVLKRGIGSIGASAFKNCSKLTSVTIPQTVKTIGAEAFKSCTALNAVSVSAETTWQSNSFDENTAVDRTDGVMRSGTTGDLSWKIVDNLLTVEGSGPIPDCTCSYSSYDQTYSYITPWGNLSDVDAIVIGEGVTRIGDYAFGTQTYSSQVRSVQFPSTLKSIGAGAFRGNRYIGALDIPEGVQSIGASAFETCFGVRTLSLPSTLQTIGSSAFYNLGMTELVIPEGITTIPSSAFAACGSLRTVTIPASVTSFEQNAFDNCQGVEKVCYGGGRAEDWAQLSFANMHANPLSVGGTYQAGRGYTAPKAELYVKGVSVTVLRMTSADGSISPYAFMKCVNPLTLTMDEGYSGDIGQYAFFACVNMTDVSLSEGVGSIGSFAFSSCNGIDAIRLPDSVTAIGDSAFESCYRQQVNGEYAGLSTVTFGSGVATIGQQAFYNCPALREITFLGRGPVIGSNAFLNDTVDVNYRTGASWSGKTLNYGGQLTWTPLGGACGSSAFWALDEEGALILSGSGAVTSAPWASDAAQITSVALADGAGITSYPSGAFNGIEGVYAGSCGDSAAWLIADGTLTITGQGDIADYGDNNQPWFDHSEIKSLDVREGITGIGQKAFSSAAYSLRLTSVTLADSVKRIGDEAFYQSLSQCTSIELPSGLEQIGQRAFQTAGMTSLTLPAKLSYIGPRPSKIPAA